MSSTSSESQRRQTEEEVKQPGQDPKGGTVNNEISGASQAGKEDKSSTLKTTTTTADDDDDDAAAASDHQVQEQEVPQINLPPSEDEKTGESRSRTEENEIETSDESKATKPTAQYAPVPPPPSVDEATLRRRAAEARAYALSDTSKKFKGKVISSSKPPAYGHPSSVYPNYAPAPDGRSIPTGNNGQHRPPPPPAPPSHPPHAHYTTHHYYYSYPYYPPPYGYHHYPPPPGAAGTYPAAPISGYPSFPSNQRPPPSSSSSTHPVQGSAPKRSESPPHHGSHSTTTAAVAATQAASSSPAPSPPSAPATDRPAATTTTAASSTAPKNSSLATFSGTTRSLTERRSTYPMLTQQQQHATKTTTAAEEGVDPLMTLNPLRFEDEDDDYVKFVRSLGLQDADSVQMAPEDDDEEDFMLTSLDDDDEEEEDDEDDEEEDEEDNEETQQANKQDGLDAATNGQGIAGNPLLAGGGEGSASMESPPLPTKKKSAWTLDLPEFDPNFYRELEEELGGLEEEDLEAAVASLLGTTSTSYAHVQKHDANDGNGARGENISSIFAAEAKANETEQAARKEEPDREMSSPNADLEMGTPLRNATGMRTKTLVTPQQVERLQTLLNRHYQVLVQQAVLAIQAAHLAKTHRFRDKTDYLSGESADDLVHVLDAAVGMVQDLDQNRKDAIRNAIQFEDATTIGSVRTKTDLFNKRARPNHVEEHTRQKRAATSRALSEVAGVPRDQRRLTRAAFSKTLQQQTGRKSVFNVKGLHRLQETFHALDRSIGSGSYMTEAAGEKSWYTETCRGMLQQAGAEYEERLLPGVRDLAEIFSTPQEYLGEEFRAPCSEDQERFLRRFRSLFTSGEDNLVLRGVNLYGEKQWILIADRYLPDRSINNISQRYSKLCVMLYKAHGIRIDSLGCLETPPKLESVEDIDDEKVALIKKASPPALLNVHRWSLEEDLTLLRAVPLMGHMWAELGARLIPHRDRGHLRKRYQVLERRVKATVTRYLKGHDSVAKVASKVREATKVREKVQQRRNQSKEQARQHEAKQQPQNQKFPPPHQQMPPLQIPSHIPPHLRVPCAGPPIPVVPRAPPSATDALLAAASKPSVQPLPKCDPKAAAVVNGTASKAPPSEAAAEQGPAKKAKQTHDGDDSKAAPTKEDNKSQESRIKELMESEVESEIVGTLANRLAKPEHTAQKPPRPPASKKSPDTTDDVEKTTQRSSKTAKGVKRKNTLPTTRSSKRVAAAKKSKETIKRKSPLLLGSRAGSAAGANPSRGSKRAPSLPILVAKGKGTSDGDEKPSGNGASNDVRESNGSSHTKISAHDMEAVSALNSLSNSASLSEALTRKTGPAASTRSGSKSGPAGSTRSAGKGDEEDKSFFAKITGRVKDRDKRKRKIA